MPTASLEYNMATTIPGAGQYQVVYSITSQAEFPDDKVFVMRSSDDALDHIATVDDFSVWPTTKDPAKEFYRLNAATVIYGDPETATRAMETVALAVKALVAAFAEWREEFDPDRSATVSETFS